VYIIYNVLLSVFYTAEETEGLVSWLNFDFVSSCSAGLL